MSHLEHYSSRLIYITHDANRVHELSCLIEGETRAFSVEIRLDASVSKRKEKIKSKTQHDLDSVDTNIYRDHADLPQMSKPMISPLQDG
jgi:hypothetical protein